jgi:ActR/RegA family two-component response regulator
MLRREFEVETATSSEQALGMLVHFAPRIVITDFQLGLMSGSDLLAYIRAQFPTTRRVLTSGYAEPKLIDVTVRSGVADRFLSKPFGADEVLTTVHELLADRRLA